MTPKEFNDWRIVPRILVFSAYLFTGYAWLLVVRWFMAYDFSAIESEAVALVIAGFPASILMVLTTSLGKLTDNYFRTGDARMPQ